MRNIQELKSWPEFHNAVASGLRLAPILVIQLIIFIPTEYKKNLHHELCFCVVASVYGYLKWFCSWYLCLTNAPGLYLMNFLSFKGKNVKNMDHI